MRIRLIRSATLLLDFGGRRFLVDPDFAEQHSRPSFTGRARNPMVALPIPPSEIVEGLEAVIVSHLHQDHFDATAVEALSWDLPTFCQPEDESRLRETGFREVRPVQSRIEWGGIRIRATPCRHGTGRVLDEMGPASGFLLTAAGEPTVYWMGDTVWTEEAAEVVDEVRPEVIVTHSCGAVWGPKEVLIVMDSEQTIEACRRAPEAVVIAVHMDAFDHATISRQDLRAAADSAGISRRRLLLPADGEAMTIHADAPV